MYSSVLQQQYASENANGGRAVDTPTQANSLQAIIDPRFDALVNRAKVLRRSNQIRSETSIDISSPNGSSAAQLDSALERVDKRQLLSPTWKHRLQGLLIGLLVTAISVGTILAVLLTRSSSTTVSSCATLQWNAIGTTVIGNGSSGSSLNQLNGPTGIFVHTDDSIYIADTSNHRVLRVSLGSNGTNNVTVVAGITGMSTVSSTTLNNPRAVYVDSNQNLYVVDTDNFRVQLWPYGASNSSTVAGSSTGVPGSTLDKLGYSFALYVDTAKNVYVSDASFGRVVKWSSGASTGVLVAGSGSSGYSSSQLNFPLGITVDSNNNTLYIADFQSHTIISWPVGTTTGTIIAGLNATSGSIASLLYAPWGIIRDTYGNLYVSDYGNHRIQFYCSNGSSFSSGTTIAGMGTAQLSSRGLNRPTGLAFDSQMNLYVVDYGNHRVQKFLRTN
ncbi:unnamed protein product [Rotaria sordida]|uniref:NHL repeat-containing protein n=1 Tax=Rotaria sordida TaxID=392033 RepID=A0A818TBJ5_9BILA|nr:unnamed protein product [Rotaria sordida]